MNTIDIGSLANDVRNLQIAQLKAEMRYDGIVAILRRLIEANPQAVHVDDIERLLHDEHAETIALREAGYRRADINQFLRDVGLMRPAQE